MFCFLDILILIIMFAACVLAYVLGVLTMASTKSSDEHRAYLKGKKAGYKEGFKDGSRRFLQVKEHEGQGL